MILSKQLTGKYYKIYLGPLMSHKFWTVTAPMLLEGDECDKWKPNI